MKSITVSLNTYNIFKDTAKPGRVRVIYIWRHLGKLMLASYYINENKLYEFFLDSNPRKDKDNQWIWTKRKSCFRGFIQYTSIQNDCLKLSLNATYIDEKKALIGYLKPTVSLIGIYDSKKNDIRLREELVVSH